MFRQSYKKRVNKLVTEEFGISNKLHNEILPRFHTILKDSIKNTNVIVKNGVKIRENCFVFDFFEDNKYLLKTYWTVYYFDSDEEYKSYIKNHFLPNGVIYENKMFMLTIIYINNKPLDNSFYDTIGHELEHLFQNILMKKEFSNQHVYNIAQTYIYSNDEYNKSLSYIIYASTKSEQEAMINGCYNEFIHSEKRIDNIDDFIENSECGVWLKNLYFAYNFIKTHKDEKLYIAIKKYKKIKDYYTYKYFLYIARNGILNFERRIARLNNKLKKLFINDHTLKQINENYDNSLLNYYLIK